MLEWLLNVSSTIVGTLLTVIILFALDRYAAYRKRKKKPPGPIYS